MEIPLRADEIAGHGMPGRDGRVQEFLASGGAPDCQQAADDDAAIKEVREQGRLDFEGHGPGRLIPSAQQKAGP